MVPRAAPPGCEGGRGGIEQRLEVVGELGALVAGVSLAAVFLELLDLPLQDRDRAPDARVGGV